MTEATELGQPEEPWREVVFRRRWWLDAVAPGSWDEVNVESGGRVSGHLPFAVLRLPLGRVGLVSPPMTPRLGPWIAPGAPSAQRTMAALIEALPRFDYFAQNFDPDVTDWLPFHWAGFQQTTRYTYLLDDVSDGDRIWAGLGDKTRNVIRKAQRTVQVRESGDPAELARLVEATFTRQRLRAPFGRDLIQRVHDAVRSNNAGTTLVASDEQGRNHASVLLAWDRGWTYYLLSGADPELRQSGATSLLVWEAIQRASSLSRGFDFEGSMLQPVERFFRSFGARQVPYFAVRKARRPVQVLLSGRNLVRELRRR